MMIQYFIIIIRLSGLQGQDLAQAGEELFDINHALALVLQASYLIHDLAHHRDFTLLL